MFEKINLTEENILEFLVERVYAKDSEFNLELYKSKGNGRNGRQVYYMQGDVIDHLWVTCKINRAPRFSVFPDQDIIEKANKWIKRKRKLLCDALQQIEHNNRLRADASPLPVVE